MMKMSRPPNIPPTHTETPPPKEASQKVHRETAKQFGQFILYVLGLVLETFIVSILNWSGRIPEPTLANFVSVFRKQIKPPVLEDNFRAERDKKSPFVIVLFTTAGRLLAEVCIQF